MTVAVAADHAGFALKQWLLAELTKDGVNLLDLGTHDEMPSDYPDHAAAVGRAVQSGKADRGILICGSGVGACIAANKMKGIRAGVCHDTYSGHQGVEHDDMNVLCLGSRIIGQELALEIARAFVKAKVSNEERYRRRVNKVSAMEQQQG
ncbi:MAG: ribose 5-phosphate isomerase B [Bacteroidota bacterium]